MPFFFLTRGGLGGAVIYYILYVYWYISKCVCKIDRAGEIFPPQVQIWNCSSAVRARQRQRHGRAIGIWHVCFSSRLGGLKPDWLGCDTAANARRDLISQKMKVVKIPILEHHSRDTITQKGTNFPFRTLHIDTFYHDWVQSEIWYKGVCENLKTVTR